MEIDRMLQHIKDMGWVVVAIPPDKIPADVNKGHLEELMEDRAYDYLGSWGEEYHPNDDAEYDIPDNEADAEVLKSAGWGTDEDYNHWNEVE